jgi:glutaredoxin
MYIGIESPQHKGNSMNTMQAPRATLYRMVMDKHVCPYGLKARDLLRRKGYRIDDRWLTTREEVDAFKDRHQVKTTPQAFLGEERIGGYDDLRRHFGIPVPDAKAASYRPVLAVFVVTLLMAAAASRAVDGEVLGLRTLRWFIAFSMCALAMLKLQNVERFSSMFLGYDLLARRWVRYAYLYPVAELTAGLLMIAGVLTWLSAPIALVIGGIGAASVIKAVYIDKRELKCACVGGDSNVPLGFLSLTENLLMIAMGIAMPLAAYAG